MLRCSSCGFESNDANYCTNCGMKMPTVIDGNTGKTTVGDSSEMNTFIPAKGHASDGDVSGESPAQLPADVERIKSKYVELPDSSGQTIFTVVNIIAGILFLCVGGFISLIFSIIAAVHISKADKAKTREEAEDALGVAKMMNMTAVVVLLLSFAAGVILFMMLIFI